MRLPAWYFDFFEIIFGDFLRSNEGKGEIEENVIK